MASFTVDSEAVLQATHAAQGTLSRMQADATTLASQLHGLQASWSGQAAGAFQNVLNEWEQTQQRVSEVMDSLHRALAAAASHYADIEQENARMFSY